MHAPNQSPSHEDPAHDDPGRQNPVQEGGAAANSISRGSRRVWNCLYTSNPFYVISAALVLFGLRMSFDTGAADYQAGLLMTGLIGYTLLLAAATVLLIRFGRVWDDARSLLLLVVLMMLATSVLFDDAIASSWSGAIYSLVGLVFSIVISEAVLAGTRIRLPALFRLPYYALLALFFLYPVAMRPLLAGPHSEPLHTALLAFPFAAGFCLMLAWPAARQTSGYVIDSGTPWRWPLFPWSLFVVLVACACFRSYYLCCSFSMFEIFSPYFLTPIVLAVSLIALELSLTARHAVARAAALIAPAVWLGVLMLDGAKSSDQAYFLSSLMLATGATPIFLTLLALILFYTVAALRQVPGGFAALCCSLMALSVVSPTTLEIASMSSPVGWPLLLVALLTAVRAARHCDSRVWMFSLSCCLLGLMVDYPSSWFMVSGGLVPLHFLVAGALAFGMTLDDRFAVLLRSVTAPMLIGCWAATVNAYDAIESPVSLFAIGVYTLTLSSLAYSIGRWREHGWHQFAAVVSLSAWLALAAWHGIASARQHVSGFHYLAYGGAFFVVATAISLSKMSGAGRVLLRLRLIVQRLVRHWWRSADVAASQQRATGGPDDMQPVAFRDSSDRVPVIGDAVFALLLLAVLLGVSVCYVGHWLTTTLALAG